MRLVAVRADRLLRRALGLPPRPEAEMKAKERAWRRSRRDAEWRRYLAGGRPGTNGGAAVMKWDEKDEHCTLASGRRFYVCCGVLGMGEDRFPENLPGLFGGFDDEIDVIGATPPFTEAERKEIAVEMIARWIRWADLKGPDVEKDPTW